MRKFYLSSLMVLPLTIGPYSACATHRVPIEDVISDLFMQQMKHEKYVSDLGIPEECVIDIQGEEVTMRVINHKVMAKSLRNRRLMLHQKMKNALNSDKLFETVDSIDYEQEIASSTPSTPTISAKGDVPEKSVFSDKEVERLQEKFRSLHNPQEDNVWNALFQKHALTEGTSHTFVLESAKLLPPEHEESMHGEFGPTHLYTVALSKLLIEHIKGDKSADELLKHHTLRNDTNLKLVFLMTLFNSFLGEKEYNKAMQTIKQAFRFSLTEQQLLKIKHLIVLVSPKVPKEIESFKVIKKILDIQSLV